MARRRRRGRGSRCAGLVQAQQARRSETDAQASEEVCVRPGAVGDGRLSVIRPQRPAIAASSTCMSAAGGRTTGSRIRISRPDGGAQDTTLQERLLRAEIPISHAAVYNTVNVKRHLISAQQHRVLRTAVISTWREVVAAA
jgi:hypothetical protein